MTTQDKKTLPAILALPQCAADAEWLSSPEGRVLRATTAKERGVPEDEFKWVGKNGEEARFGYLEQRRALDFVCGEIQKEFPDRHASPDDVFKEFLNAHFTGRLLPIARLVEKTFGEGGFRLLGMMETNASSGIETREALWKARVRRLKQKSKR